MTKTQHQFYKTFVILSFLLGCLNLQLVAQVDNCPEGDIFTYSDFSSTPNLYLFNGTKRVNNAIQLTEQAGDIGLLYGITKFRVQDGFSSTFSFKMDKATGEGFSLMIHPNYAIYNLSNAGGAGLGYNGIRRNVAIEFDVQQSEGETNDNHISIQTNGTRPNSSHPDLALASEKVNIDMNDGQLHFAKILYVNGRLSVFLDDFDQPVTSANIEIESLLNLDDSGAYLVFTSANGATAGSNTIYCWSTQTEVDDTCSDVVLGVEIELIGPTTCGKAVGQAAVVLTGSGSGTGSGTGTGGNNYMYLWSNGEIFNEAFQLAGGLNTVTITDENGCSEELSIEIPDPDQPVTGAFSYEIGETAITFTDLSTGAIVNQNWSSDLPTSIIDNAVELPNSGRYEVCLTVENECGTEDTFCKIINIGIEPNEPQCVDGDIFTYSDFSTTPNLYLFGDVKKTDDFIRLTGTSQNELSTLYGIHKINMTEGFQTSFTFQISDPSDVAEGFALMVHPNFAIYNQSRARRDGLGYNGVARNVAIEFDIQADPDGLNGQHVAIHTNGTRPNRTSPAAMLAGEVLPFDINDGQVHNAKIIYNNQTLSVFVDNFTKPILQTTIDISESLNLDESGAYLVFTGATSATGTTQDLLCWSANSVEPIIENPAEVIFQTAPIEDESGTTITIPVTSKNFQNILGFQTALQFANPTIGKITGFTDFNLEGLGEEDFNIDDDHQFSVVWFQESPITVADETPLFSVEVTLAETTTKTCTPFEKNTDGIITEVIGAGFNKMDAELDFADICVLPKEITNPDILTFTIDDAQHNPGQLLQIPIRVSQFKDIVSVQKTIRLSQSGVGRIIGTSNYGLPELSNDNFNFINDTLITLVWFKAEATTLPDDHIIYTLDILLMDTENTACVDLLIDDSRTAIEVADKDLTILDYAINTGEVCVEIAQSEAVFISGYIETEIGQAMENISVNCTDESPATSDNFGFYQFENLSPDSNYEIIPTKENNPLQNVSTLDLVLIMKHILDKERLDSPYKMLAADVNQDGRISSVDLVVTRQLILNIRTVFPNDLSWLFIPKAYQFEPNKTPNINEIPQSITILEADGRYINQDFIAVKMGDVSYDLTDGFTTEIAQTRNSKPTIPFTLKNQFFDKGDLVKVPISTNHFQELLGYQMTLSFNPEIISFKHLVPSDLQTDLVFNATPTAQGLLPILWYSSSNATDRIATRQETKLFTLTFEAKQAGSLANLFQINSQYLPDEAVINGNKIRNIELVFKSDLATPNDLQFTKIYPNPAPHTARLLIESPVVQTAKIQVLDIHGRVSFEQKTSLSKGSQEIVLPLTNLVDGVYYVAVNGDSIGEQPQIHKLIVVH